jgi:hypothetical protein
MSKTIHRGSAGPDDPIYREGLQIFTPIPRPQKPAENQPPAADNAQVESTPADAEKEDGP